jgi:methyl-accepting chemotaxis protein
MDWNSLIPRTFKPWELQWPINNLDDLTDIWLLGTIGISIIALFWACYRTWEAVTRTGRYLNFLKHINSSEEFASVRMEWLRKKGLPLAPAFNELLVEFPTPGKPLERVLKRCANASEVFNPSTLAHGLVGNRFLLAMPGILTGLGVLGTFVGLQIGIGGLELDSSQIENLDKSIAPIIKGCSTAFATSVWGVVCSLLFTVIEKFLEWMALTRIQHLQSRVDAIIPRYTPEESMIELQRASAETEGVLKGLAVAIGDEMQKAMNRLGSSITEAVKDSLGNNATALGDGAAKVMSAALTEELDRLRGAVTGMADGFKSEFLGASTELNTTILGFDKLLGGVDSTVKASSDAMKQAVERLSAHEEVVKHLDDGAARLKEAAVELTSLRETFTLSAQRNAEAATAQERAATVNKEVANKLQLVGDKLPEVQASLTDGGRMIASLGQPLLDLKELLGKTPEVFGGQLNTTLSGFETVIKGVDDTVRSSRDAMVQAVERLTAHEEVVIQLKAGSIRLQEAANELSSMRDTFTLSAQKNSDAAAAQEKAAHVNESVANKFQLVGDKLPQVQEAISDGARIIASLGQPLLALRDVLDTTPQIFGQQAELQADRDERRSSLLLDQTEKLAATVAAAAEKFAQVEALSNNLGASSGNLERAGLSLAELADAIKDASLQHASAAKSSERAALAGERAADKLTPLPDSLSGVSTTLSQAGGQIKIGAEAARDVYSQMLVHQKEWFKGIEVGLRGMKDQVQTILDAYGDKVEGATRDHMVQWTKAVEDSLGKFAVQVQTLEGAINDLTSEKRK